MSGKGKKYWESVWDEREEYSDEQKLDRMLKRYSFQCFNSYGKEVHQYYYPGLACIEHRRSNSIESALSNLKQKILNNSPIWKDGDLYNIISLVDEKLGTNHLSAFTVRKKSSICDCIFGFFSSLCDKNTVDKNAPTSTSSYHTFT
jgi:hypothetical protein